MNIDEMADQEKSVMLARSMGWTLRLPSMYSSTPPYLSDVTGQLIGEHCDYPDLYDTTSMALAWRVHLWIKEQDYGTDGFIAEQYDMWWEDSQVWREDNAQRLWLDKIVELCVEAELVSE